MEWKWVKGGKRESGLDKRERERALNAGLTIESATFVKDNVSLASQGP